MPKIETLTAYECNFRYLLRNNPLIEECREDIKNGKDPEYCFSDFLNDYRLYVNKLAIGEESDRAIFLSENNIVERKNVGVKSWYLVPQAGKQGKSITVINKDGKVDAYGPDSAALYDHHMFVYENRKAIYVIFHRQNGSGCKSVFLETANKALKPKGIKLEMSLVVPMMDLTEQALPTRIVLQFCKQNKSSDIADNLDVSRKKQTIRDLGINLEVIENKKILKIVRELQIGKIRQEQAFALIKKEINDETEYNDAEVKLRIGRRYKTVPWNEFEYIMGYYDISDSLHKALKETNNFTGELTKLADKYYAEIIKSKEV